MDLSSPEVRFCCCFSSTTDRICEEGENPYNKIHIKIILLRTRKRTPKDTKRKTGEKKKGGREKKKEQV